MTHPDPIIVRLDVEATLARARGEWTGERAPDHPAGINVRWMVIDGRVQGVIHFPGGIVTAAGLAGIARTLLGA